MTGPWEDYKSQPGGGPWEDYSTPQPKSLIGGIRQIADENLGRDPDVDYNLGVQNARFRFDFSAMDSPEEKANYLDKTVGEGNWGYTPAGDWWVSKGAAQKLGSPVSTKRGRIAIDPDRLDAYDILELPLGAIGAATAAGLATGGAGFIPAMLATGAAGAAGAVAPEVMEATGRTVATPMGSEAITQQETPMEIAPRAAVEGALSAGGEGLFRGAGALARRAFMGARVAPSGRTTAPQEVVDLLETAREAGIRPRTGMLVKSEPIRRGETYGIRAIGDPWEELNEAALRRQLEEVRRGTGTGRGAPPQDLETTITDALKAEMDTLNKQARDMWGSFEQMAGGKPVVGTRNQYEALERISDQMGPFAPKGVRALKRAIVDEGVNALTPTQAWQRASALRAMQSAGPFKGIAQSHLRDLRKAVEADMDEAADIFGHEGLNRARAYYRDAVNRLNTNTAKALRKTPSEGGKPTEVVVDWIFQPGGMNTRLFELRNALGSRSDAWKQIQDEAMERLTSKMFRRGEGGLGMEIDGPAFHAALDNVGDRNLMHLFGKDQAEAMRRFATLVESTVANPGGNAGNIAIAKYLLHPMSHLGALSQLWVVRNVIRSPAFQTWSTKGFGTPGGRKALQRIMATALRPVAQSSTRFDISDLPRAVVPQTEQEE